MANIKDHFNLVKCMGMVNLYGMTEECIKENFNKGICMEEEL